MTYDAKATKRFAVGAGWLYAYRWGERLLDLVSIVVLARLLTPEDFGLVAIAASIVTIIEGLSDFDVNKALIRHREDPPKPTGAKLDRIPRDLYDTAWTLSSLRGLIAALIMVLIAALLPDTRISWILAALAATPIFKGLANPLFVAFERDLVYSKLAIATLGARLATLIVTLTVAVLYRSYWALVLGTLVGALVTTLLTYTLRPYRPRISLSRFADIFGFSGWMSLTTVVTTLSMETDKLIVGRLLGVVEAGHYFMTQKVGVLPTRELISPLQRILFPSFSEIASDHERLRRVVRESINVLGSLSLPAGFGFALVAAEFVPIALGSQWLPIVPLLTLLVPFLGLRGTLSMTLPCVMALGRTRLLFSVSSIYALIHVPVFVAGTALYGLMGAIGGIVVAGVLYTYLNYWLLQHTLGITLGEVLSALKRPALATALMVAAVLAAAPSFLALPAWLLLLAKTVLGVAVYSVTLVVLWCFDGHPEGLERRLQELLSR